MPGPCTFRYHNFAKKHPAQMYKTPKLSDKNKNVSFPTC